MARKIPRQVYAILSSYIHVNDHSASQLCRFSTAQISKANAYYIHEKHADENMRWFIWYEKHDLQKPRNKSVFLFFYKIILAEFTWLHYTNRLTIHIIFISNHKFVQLYAILRTGMSMVCINDNYVYIIMYP